MYIACMRHAPVLAVRRLGYAGLLLATFALGPFPGRAQAPGGAGAHAGEHQHLDSRFGHNRYYYDRGYAVHTPPDGGLANLHAPDGQRYYFHDGNWYRWRGSWDQSWRWDRWWHGGWVVSPAPAGMLVPLAPPYFTVVWWGQTPYYYANDAYYVWDAARNEYQVVAPPAGLDAAGTKPAPVAAGAADQLFADPARGQSPEQQSADRSGCNQWARAESAYDPGAADPAGQARDKREAYFRAYAACLGAAGYLVK